MSINKCCPKRNYKPTVEIRHQIVSCVPMPTVNVSFHDPVSGKRLGRYQFAHSYHSQVRSSQRGFSIDDLLNVLEFGRKIEKLGVIFHIVSFRDTPEHLLKFSKNKWQEWVVVTNPQENLIITCYKAHRALKRIRKKLKTVPEGHSNIDSWAKSILRRQ